MTNRLPPHFIPTLRRWSVGLLPRPECKLFKTVEEFLSLSIHSSIHLTLAILLLLNPTQLKEEIPFSQEDYYITTRERARLWLWLRIWRHHISSRHGGQSSSQRDLKRIYLFHKSWTIIPAGSFNLLVSLFIPNIFKKQILSHFSSERVTSQLELGEKS